MGYSKDLFLNRSSNGLKLAYVPDWSFNNPYQKLLYNEVAVAGVNCHGLQGREFTFAWILKNVRNFNFIHLHWLLGIYPNQKKGLCWSNLIIVLAKILLSRLLGYKVLWTIHNIVPHETSNYDLEIAMRKIVARLVNKVIVHCDYAKTFIIKSWEVPVGKVVTVPHGSYIGYYPNDVSRSNARRALNIPEDKFTFLYFGMLRNYKGVKDLLSSYYQLKKANPDIHLIIAGYPPNEVIKNDIEAMANDKQISLHLRYISDNDVQLFFNASDVVVLPYLNILTSGAAVLALSFGRPVIAPAKGCIPELLDETFSFLYHKKQELADAMANAVTKKGNREIKKKAFERAQELKWNRIVADYYLPILRELEN